MSLRLFETGIGILAIELYNYDHPLVEDVLLINDYGRRIYPQFLSNDDGIEAVKEKFLADRIEFTCQDFSSDECLLYDKYFASELRVANYIERLLGQPFRSKFKFIPIIDDRMYVVCWYGSDALSAELSRKNEKTEALNFKNSDIWYKLIFVDGKGINCANEELKKDLIRRSTYGRWVERGTFFGISRYSFICVTDAEYFGCEILRNHMRRHYCNMAMIVLAQRASILKFSARVTDISKEISTFAENDAEDKSRNKASFDNIFNNVKELDASFMRFTNRLWFTEITPQEQGIEMYNIAVSVMGLKEHLTDIKSDIKELHEFINMGFEELAIKKSQATNEAVLNVNKIAGVLTHLMYVFLPISVVAGIFTIADLIKIPPVFAFAKGDISGKVYIYAINLSLAIAALYITFNFLRYLFIEFSERITRSDKKEVDWLSNFISYKDAIRALRRPHVFVPFILLLIVFGLYKYQFILSIIKRL